MRVKINGVGAELPEGYSIKELVSDRNLPENVVIVELNGEIINRGKWEQIKLNPEDSLELIRIITGG